MSIYGIKNTALRRTVLTVAVIPLFILMALLQIVVGVAEAFEDTVNGWKHCWQARTDIKLATIKDTHAS